MQFRKLGEVIDFGVNLHKQIRRTEQELTVELADIPQSKCLLPCYAIESSSSTTDSSSFGRENRRTLATSSRVYSV